jgi:hypothetical protein
MPVKSESQRVGRSHGDIHLSPEGIPLSIQAAGEKEMTVLDARGCLPECKTQRRWQSRRTGGTTSTVRAAANARNRSAVE